MYAIYGNIYHQYTPNVRIYTIHGSYGTWLAGKSSTNGTFIYNGKIMYCINVGFSINTTQPYLTNKNDGKRKI